MTAELGSQDPAASFVSLGADGTACAVAGGEAFWSQSASVMAELGAQWLVSAVECRADWPTWERHPNGDEYVYVISGAVVLHIEAAEGVRKVPIASGGFVIVPRGAWHTAKASVPSRLLHITLGAGTELRAL